MSSVTDIISTLKQQQIAELLGEIEERHDITIIHAVESGSRAWGFPSEDSDYDIRFIYHHPSDWYISAFEKKDSLDLALKFDLDAAGWDIGKCLRLLYKSNSPLYEWLSSPIIYRQDACKIKLLQDLALRTFNPKASAYHYLSLAKKKLLSDKIHHNAKSFLYALRAILCAQWIADENSPPPVDAIPLIERYLLKAELFDMTQRLIDDKRTQSESQKSSIDPVLMYAVTQLYESLRDADIPVKRMSDPDVYDTVLRAIVFAK